MCRKLHHGAKICIVKALLRGLAVHRSFRGRGKPFPLRARGCAANGRPALGIQFQEVGKGSGLSGTQGSLCCRPPD